MTPPLADTRIQPPTDNELAAIVRNFHTARVLVIGDIILDRYIAGAVHRLSPEAPIPVLRPATNRSWWWEHHHGGFFYRQLPLVSEVQQDLV